MDLKGAMPVPVQIKYRSLPSVSGNVNTPTGPLKVIALPTFISLNKYGVPRPPSNKTMTSSMMLVPSGADAIE